jgi:hypothetical protein
VGAPDGRSSLQVNRKLHLYRFCLISRDAGLQFYTSGNAACQDLARRPIISFEEQT